MNKIITRIVNNKFLTGSFVLLVAFNLFNALNFVFQAIMARALTKEDYGILASLFSIIYMLGLLMETAQTGIVKVSSTVKSDGKLKDLYRKALKSNTKIAAILFFAYLCVSVGLIFLLKINFLYLAITGLSIFVVLWIPIPRGIMLGRKMFTALGINMVFEAIVKLGLAVSLVYLGFSVGGAIAGTILATLIAFLFSLFTLRRILNAKEEKVEKYKIYENIGPLVVIMFTIMIFYSFDVFWARAFLTESMAGSYAIASVLAKIIFFGTHPISRAMFPISVANKQEGKRSGRVFLYAFVMVFTAIIVALLGFYFLSDWIVWIFSGKELFDSARILVLVGISMGIISIANLVLLHKLSIGDTRRYWILPVFLVLQAALFYVFSSNLFIFSLAFIAVSAAFLFGSVAIVGKK